MCDKRVGIVLASIGANVRELRLRRGLTQESLAEKCAIEPRTVQSIERGRTNLSIAVLVSVADALGVDSRMLMRPGELPPARAGRPPKPKKKTGRHDGSVVDGAHTNPRATRRPKK